MKYAKFLRTPFDRTPPNELTTLLKSTNGKLHISCASCRISTSRYTKKLFYRCFSSVLNKNKR